MVKIKGKGDMNKYTCFILNKNNRKVVYVLQDGFLLFSKNGSSFLDEILSENSERMVSNILDDLSKKGQIYNLPVNILVNKEQQGVYFSGFCWMENYFVCFSEEEKQFKLFSSQQEGHRDLRGLDDTQKNKAINDELTEISRLNNELIQIQRELTKKNLNLEMLNKRLEELATTDPLTGILNRRAILERLGFEINRAYREKRSFGLALLDIDEFKKINDQYGHLMGDDALKITSMCLRETTREYDIAGRFGGDEFLVFFLVESGANFRNILNRLLIKINSHKLDISGEITVRIKISIGGVFVHSFKNINEIKINTLMKKADDALYNAKDAGGNTVRILDYSS